MAFGIYIHIPYCIQRCPYCDFATYEKEKIPSFNSYVELLLEEIKQKSSAIPYKQVSTLFFGGGTPSLFDAELIKKIFVGLKEQGFFFSNPAEITIEINPATLDPKKIEGYLELGINRFSVGAQTFQDRLLKKIGRKHSVLETVETINLLKKYKTNYSLDLLFALPNQTLDELNDDLDKMIQLSPHHISAYYLTIPESNPLSLGRPLEAKQLQMFESVYEKLTKSGLLQYELSNFAVPGYESKHNLLYWTDESYWGIGLSAHSYINGNWGLRFWNPKGYSEYEQLIKRNWGLNFSSPVKNLSKNSYELLKKYESLTDFCHTSLRLSRGLSVFALQKKFGSSILNPVFKELKKLQHESLVENRAEHYYLSKTGKLISNKVFERLTFLEEDIT